MNLNHLRQFCAVVDARGVTRAARRLHVSQQAVSLQIKRLERDLGFPLFTRVGRALEVTPLGDEVYRRGRAVLDALGAFDRWVEERQAGHRAKVWVLCSSTPGAFVMPSVLPVFHQLCPGVEVVLRVVMTEQMAGALAQMASLDFAVHIEEFSHPRLRTEAVARDELWLVAHPGHPLATRPSISLAELARHQIVLRQEPSQCTLARCLLDVLNRRGLHPDVLYVGSMEGCRTAAERGLGVTYLSRFAAEEAVRAGLLKRLQVPGLQHYRTLYVAQPVGATLSEPARVLIDLVREHLADAMVPRARLAIGRPVVTTAPGAAAARSGRRSTPGSGVR